MSKKYIWTIVISLIVLISGLLIIKSYDQKNDKEVKGIGVAAQASTFKPVTTPVIEKKERILGSTKAPVQIFVYEDYSDIFSAELSNNLEKLSKEYGKKVSFVLRPFINKSKNISLEAALAIECAADSDKWQEMRLSLFDEVVKGSLSSQSIKVVAKNIGLNENDFSKCLTSEEKKGIILQVTDNSKMFSVYGAPTLFINDEMIIGSRPYNDYTDLDGITTEGLKSLVERNIQ